MQQHQNRSRIIGGALLIILGALLLLTNNLELSWEAWLWMIVLGGAAVALVYVHRTTGELWAAIGAYIAGAAATIILTVVILEVEGNLVPTVIMLLIAAPFAYVGSRNREQWGFLVPAYVMVAIIPILFLAETGSEEMLVPAYVMTVIGLPFIVAAIFTRKWPFLIPGGILLFIAALFLLDAIEAFASVGNLLFAIILIGIGLYMLAGPRLRGGKPKREG